MTTHSHNHHHHQEEPWSKRLAASMAINLLIPAVQIYGGILSGSMALISDALHNLSDFMALVINYAASIIRPCSLKAIAVIMDGQLLCCVPANGNNKHEHD